MGIPIIKLRNGNLIILGIINPNIKYRSKF